MTRPGPDGGAPMLSDRQTEALRELADPIAVGGESDWEVAVHVYALQTPLTYSGGSVPAGLHVRTVSGKSECAYPATDAAAAIAYAAETVHEYEYGPDGHLNTTPRTR